MFSRRKASLPQSAADATGRLGRILPPDEAAGWLAEVRERAA